MVRLAIPGRPTCDVVGGEVLLPRTGIWLATLRMNLIEELPDRVTLDLAGTPMPAAVVKAQLIGGVTEARIVGGAGGLGDTARPKHYHAPLVRHVLADLLRDSSEQLSATSGQTALTTNLEAWTTLALPVGAMLAAICEVIGGDTNWRVLADGTVWIGTETWPDAGVDARAIESDGANGADLVGTDIPKIWPGTLLGGRRVDYVRHNLDADRTTVLFGEVL
jgi:hypothetical protein